jgi:hypothetical protein
VPAPTDLGGWWSRRVGGRGRCELPGWVAGGGAGKVEGGAVEITFRE